MMKITQGEYVLKIKNYPTPYGKRDILIKKGDNSDTVRYLDRFECQIIEDFKEDGLYDCEGYKLKGETPWSYERIVLTKFNDDLCSLCYHFPNCDRRNDSFYIEGCDDYKRWDE
jgi:hypothetical protein